MFRAIFNIIGHDVSQSRMSLSACPNRTIFNATRSCQSHKPRVCMLQLLRILRRIAKIKGTSSPLIAFGSSGG
ncbi:hypothetical protein AXF42_Ash011392 [Apostasia shenzhenica]|uniref:Uncharacterized protein n=1 Tax=Apostasia shenzhenica TaxID=1088818 RepID=A0A2I0AED6_9ASPA|nr:hypothetical protein AXF42_Ash011392 [Apostasia shenzhenica]